MGVVRIGTAGYSYNHWIDDFYPLDIASNKRLGYYAKYFNSVEINSSFYKLPKKETLKKWAVTVPEDFVFSIKANRYITHLKNLKVDHQPINNLLDQLEPLGEKKGPILFQLPPQWNLDIERLTGFVGLLPDNQRLVVEMRNKTWYDQKVFDLLKSSHLSLCIHDHQDAPSPKMVTADFVYLRLHGPNGNYQSKYSPAELQKWAKRIKKWQKENFDVYIYFNNDFEAFAVDNAMQLKNLLNMK